MDVRGMERVYIDLGENGTRAEKMKLKHVRISYTVKGVLDCGIENDKTKGVQRAWVYGDVDRRIIVSIEENWLGLPQSGYKMTGVLGIGGMLMWRWGRRICRSM